MTLLGVRVKSLRGSAAVDLQPQQSWRSVKEQLLKQEALGLHPSWESQKLVRRGFLVGAVQAVFDDHFEPR